MNSAPERPSLHPMLWVAAASVTVLSLAGVAKLAGLLPDNGKTDTPPVVAAPPAPAPAPAVPPLAVAAAPEAAPAPEVPAAEKPLPPRHKPAAPRETHARHVTEPLASNNPAPTPNAEPSPPPSYVPPVGSAPAAPPLCHECGIVESVEAVQQKGEGSGLGAVGGAILGGVLGNQVGEGSGKKLARIGGAVLGGFAGNEAERRYRTVSHYQVTVRMEDGNRRVITTQQAPWHAGDPVRVRNGEIIAAGGSRSNF